MSDSIFPLGLAGLTYRQTEDCFPVGTDSVLLSAFVRVSKRAKVCDLGCAGGILPLLLCGRHEEIKVTGIEISEKAAAVARENAERNNLSDRIEIITADMRTVSLPAGSFDTVVCNPPYYKENSGRLPKKTSMQAARAETSCTIEEVCATAARLLRFGGIFFSVYKPARLCELLSAMEASKLTPKRLRFVLHKQGQAPVLVLVEGKKGAAPGLIVPPALVIRKSTGAYTAEAYRIYHPDE
jgi:tRNA1Val (adenine37-N6)-methyltransferase